MKSFKVLCAATLLSASLGANAEIQPVNNAALSSVSGQLILKNIKHAVGAHVKDHVTDVKRDLHMVKIVAVDHLRDFLTVEDSFNDHVANHKSDVKRNMHFVTIHVQDHISDLSSYHTRAR